MQTFAPLHQGCQLQLEDIQNLDLALNRAGGQPRPLDLALYLAAALKCQSLAQLLLQRHEDAVAVAAEAAARGRARGRARAAEQAAVFCGLNMVAREIPSNQRLELLRQYQGAFPALAAVEAALWRLKKVHDRRTGPPPLA